MPKFRSTFIMMKRIKYDFVNKLTTFKLDLSIYEQLCYIQESLQKENKNNFDNFFPFYISIYYPIFLQQEMFNEILFFKVVKHELKKS